MLLQPHYRLDPASARRLIHEHGRAAIVMSGPEGLRATYGFWLLEGGAGGGAGGGAEEELTVIGHIARADPQAADLASGGPALLVFDGPRYVSGAWYAPEITHIPSTRNYTAVHLHGVPAMLHDEEALEVVRRTLERHESALPADQRYRLDGDRLEFARKILPGTAPFRLRATRVEGEAKLSQERPTEVVQRIIDRRLEEPAPYANPELAADMRWIALSGRAPDASAARG
jgi:transcriptional regulator